MKLFSKAVSTAMAAVICSSAAVSYSVGAIDYSEPASSDRYTGNMGDSFIDTIGTRNGYRTIDGMIYPEGIELWVARWNFSEELSWAWAEYTIDDSMESFRGTLSILNESYNTDNFDTTLEISLDGEVVYTYNMTPGFKPQDIDIPLGDAETIKLYVYDNVAKMGGTSFCIGMGEGYRLGDVNMDGYVDAIDASMVLTAYANKSVGNSLGFSDLQIKCADVNIDGIVDAVDASGILAYYAYASTTSGDVVFIDEYLGVELELPNNIR